jgi:hypothetical protein
MKEPSAEGLANHLGPASCAGDGNIAGVAGTGAKADQVLTSEITNIRWPLTDNLGTIRDVADFNESTGITAIANHLVYNAYGQITSETNAAVDFHFGYTGFERDEETGLPQRHTVLRPRRRPLDQRRLDRLFWTRHESESVRRQFTRDGHRCFGDDGPFTEGAWRITRHRDWAN